MPIPLFEIKLRTGWKRLDDILELIQNAINDRTPLASETIELSEEANGLQVCLKGTSGNSSSEEAGGAGGGGSPVDVEGALDGSPAVFHLLQSSDPTPL